MSPKLCNSRSMKKRVRKESGYLCTKGRDLISSALGEETLTRKHRYASQAAMEKHESSDNYKKFFKILVEEELLAGTPIISKGKYCHAFRR